MMATVPHFTSGLGLRKFQADGFLLTRVYETWKYMNSAARKTNSSNQNQCFNTFLYGGALK